MQGDARNDGRVADKYISSVTGDVACNFEPARKPDAVDVAIARQGRRCEILSRDWLAADLDVAVEHSQRRIVDGDISVGAAYLRGGNPQLAGRGQQDGVRARQIATQRVDVFENDQAGCAGGLRVPCGNRRFEFNAGIDCGVEAGLE